jgi:hypothetical protein
MFNTVCRKDMDSAGIFKIILKTSKLRSRGLFVYFLEIDMAITLKNGNFAPVFQELHEYEG